MVQFGVLIRCIGEAVAAQGLRCLLGVAPFGERLYDIACDAHARYRKRCRPDECLAQVEAAAQAPASEVKDEVQQAVEEVCSRLPPAPQGQTGEPEMKAALAAYLEQVPSAIRSTLRRPADPAGRSLPRNFSLNSPEEFLRLLPARPPRFHPGHRVVGDWVLADLLGVGGFGEVWKAEHALLRSQPPVALKFCLDPEAARYLRHEAGLMDRVMSEGRRPGIVELKDARLDTDPPFLVYEFINGGDLCGLMHDWLRQPVQKRVQLATQVVQKLARAVGPLHRLSPPVVHRDLKPANVLVVRKESGKFDLKVGDFGIGGVVAKKALTDATRGVSRGDLLTRTLRGSHTPLYASSEQARGEPPDPRDDVHALGVIWFQLLVCDLRRGVGADYDEELRELGVSAGVIAAIKRCVAARKERRYADALELSEHLASLLADPQPSPGPVEQPSAPSDQRSTAAASAAPADCGPVQSTGTPAAPLGQPPSAVKPTVGVGGVVGSPQQSQALAPQPPLPREKASGLIVISCPHCARQMTSPSDGGGQLFRCPFCYEPFVTPSLLAPPEPPLHESAARQPMTTSPRPGHAEVAAGGRVASDDRSVTGITPVGQEGRPAGERLTLSVGTGVEMLFAWVPPGSFLMGSPESEQGRSTNEGPVHRVTLTRGFWLGIHQVTQAQWKAVFGKNPSSHRAPNFPVEQVSWPECHFFCHQLGDKTGKRFRLPTEAEWEYACRAGTSTPFSFVPSVAPSSGGGFPVNAKGALADANLQQKLPVGSFPANTWGLYEMHGNVWEWCQDWYDDWYYNGSPTNDPEGPSRGSFRVIRGGSWRSGFLSSRSAKRNWMAPGYKDNDIGCRVILIDGS